MWELKDIYYIIAGVGMVVTGIVTLIGSHLGLKQQIALVKQDLLNAKQNIEKLEGRLDDHEDKVEKKIDDLLEKIEKNHEQLNDKLDKYQDAALNKMR